MIKTILPEYVNGKDWGFKNKLINKHKKKVKKQNVSLLLLYEILYFFFHLFHTNLHLASQVRLLVVCTELSDVPKCQIGSARNV